MAEMTAYKMIPKCTKDEMLYVVDELVRCKDCKREEVCCIRRTNDPNWFCADGQRSDED